MSCKLRTKPKESASSDILVVESRCWKERDVEPGTGASASKMPGTFECALDNALAAQPDQVDGAVKG